MKIFLIQRNRARIAPESPERAVVIARTHVDARVVLGDRTSSKACPRAEWLRADTDAVELGNAAGGSPRVVLVTYSLPIMPVGG